MPASVGVPKKQRRSVHCSEAETERTPSPSLTRRRAALTQREGDTRIARAENERQKVSAARQRFLLSTIARAAISLFSLAVSGKRDREDLLRNAPAAAYISTAWAQTGLSSCGSRQDASARFTQGTSASVQLRADCGATSGPHQRPFSAASFSRASP